VALGIAVIFQTSTLAFTVLKVAGAMYLAYLAWQAFQASGSAIKVLSSSLHSSGALYRRGIMMNITNPKVSIFFLAFLLSCRNWHRQNMVKLNHRYSF